MIYNLHFYNSILLHTYYCLLVETFLIDYKLNSCFIFDNLILDHNLFLLNYLEILKLD